MPAPRLLDKKLVSASLATERKQEIDKGVKIAKAIDAIQESKVREEQELEQFRVNTLASIRIEIDAEIRERDRLVTGNKSLREERILLQAPIDLTHEWRTVHEMKAANESWQEQNTEKGIELLAKEEDLRVLSDKLRKRDEESSVREQASEQALVEAESKFSQATEALGRAEKSAQEILKNAHERENHVRIREEEATEREVSLSRRERDVDAHERDLSNREIRLKSRQETFIKAQRYIKNKTK